MCWGEDILLRFESLRHLHFGIAIHYLWVYTLEGASITECLKQHPESKRKVDRLFARWAICLFMFQAARAIRIRPEDFGLSARPVLPVEPNLAEASQGRRKSGALVTIDAAAAALRMRRRSSCAGAGAGAAATARNCKLPEAGLSMQQPGVRKRSLIAAQNFSAVAATRQAAEVTDEQRMQSMQRQLDEIRTSQHELVNMVAQMMRTMPRLSEHAMPASAALPAPEGLVPRDHTKDYDA